MNKLKIVLIGLVSMFTLSTLNAQVLNKGNFVFDAYYGTPKYYELAYKRAHNSFTNHYDYLNVSGVDAIGISGEYMLGNRIGLGLDASYSNIKYSYGYTGSEEYTQQAKIFATVATFNYHFLKNTDKFDLYGIAGIGMAYRKDYTTNKDQNMLRGSTNSGNQFAFKTGLGIRYFITDNIGLNLSYTLGVGGQLKGGLSIRF